MTEGQKKTVKWSASVISVVAAFITLWWSFDNTYARNSVVEANKQHTLQTFDMIQKQITDSIEQMSRNNRISDLNRRLNYLTETKYELKAILRKYEDPEIREELNEVLEEIDKVKAELDKLLLGE